MQTTLQFRNSSANPELNTALYSKYEKRYGYQDAMLVALKHHHWLAWLRLNRLYRMRSTHHWIPFWAKLIRAYSDNIIRIEKELFGQFGKDEEDV